MAKGVPHVENLRSSIARARELMETRDLLLDLLALPEMRLLPIFGVTQWTPQEVHGLKDQCFLKLIVELVRYGWNCDIPSFGEGRRNTLLMEMTRRGFAQSASQLLDFGAEADYNSQGYGASTPLMCTRDPEIMKKLVYYGANPLTTNAVGQTDFTYKLLKGMTPGARFYLYNTEKIPFESLMSNYRDCVLSHSSFPYEPMYPLCLVPVVPDEAPYENVIDKTLIDCMLQGYFLPFSSKALQYTLDGNLTVWRYIRFQLNQSPVVIPALVVACMACMAKLETCRTPEDFAFVEAYIEKPLPRELFPKESLSKALFAYLLFSLSTLPGARILRWLVLLGKLMRRIPGWMDVMGETPFKVVNSLFATENRNTYMLQELVTLQALLTLRVNISENFGEFNIPEEFSSLYVDHNNAEGDRSAD